MNDDVTCSVCGVSCYDQPNFSFSDSWFGDDICVDCLEQLGLVDDSVPVQDCPSCGCTRDDQPTFVDVDGESICADCAVDRGVDF